MDWDVEGVKLNSEMRRQYFHVFQAFLSSYRVWENVFGKIPHISPPHKHLTMSLAISYIFLDFLHLKIFLLTEIICKEV